MGTAGRGWSPWLILAALAVAACGGEPAGQPQAGGGQTGGPQAGWDRCRARRGPRRRGGGHGAGSGFNEAAVAEFYRGKAVTIIVGYNLGGRYDPYARALARHIGRHIPGNPTVVVENRPGAGGLLSGQLPLP